MRRALAAAAALLLVAAPACRSDSGEAKGAVSEAGLETLPVTVRTATGATHMFTAEVARTPEQQERGLMFRDSLAPDAAMLFPMSPPRPASFWMENTLIPLDLLFIRADGSVAFIAVNAVPMSRERIEVQEPVAAVLEIAGGRSAELGISEGDRVGWPGGPSL